MPYRGADTVRRASRHARRAAAALVAFVIIAAACSSDDDAGRASSKKAGASSSSSAPAMPTGLPAVDISALVRRDIPEGAGTPQVSAVQQGSSTATDGSPDRSLAANYVEREYLVEGEASTYTGPATGPAVRATDGNHYVTRVVVRAPKDADRFNGRVLLEPLNTSGGGDFDAVWSQSAQLLQSQGDAWVGVTVRRSSDGALKAADPVRYAPVSIPSNDVEWDILRQVGAVLKEGGPQSPLAEAKARHLYVVGYSQSGLDTATFAMAFAPLSGTPKGAPVFDGYLPAAHSGSITPLTSGDAAIPTFEHAPMAPVAMPVVDPETQSDVEGFAVAVGGAYDYTSPAGASVRRDDSDAPDDRYRLYELAGAPHAGRIPGCDGQGSTFPTFMFLGAALENLFRWAEDGVVPPRADRLALAKKDVVSEAEMDDDGNAVGGVRSPFVDVALSTYTVHSTPGPMCKLGGAEAPLPAAVLRPRYDDAAGYMQQFEKRLDATIKAGFLLERDRDEIVRVQRTKAEAAFG